jgi:hypothetical protein
LCLFDNHYKHIACHARPQEHQCHEQQAACHFTKVFRVFTRFMDAVISGWRYEQHGCDIEKELFVLFQQSFPVSLPVFHNGIGCVLLNPSGLKRTA